MRTSILRTIVVIGIVLFSSNVFAQICVDCHKKVTPNIVSDWELSRHSKAGVDCAVCHGDGHKTDQDISKVKIPTPDTCAPCHGTRVEQFKKGKHALHG